MSDPFDTICFRDVLVGDVWLVIGDRCAAAPFARQRSAADDRPALRLFSNGCGQSQRSGVWAPDRFDPRAYDVGNPGNIDAKEAARLHFSGLGYWLGRKLHDQTKQPVGIIASATEKATPLSAWLPPAVLEAKPDLKPFWTATPHQFSAYSAYVQGVTPFAIKGIVWCGSHGAEETKLLLPELIRACRKDWQLAGRQEPLPFLLIPTSVLPEDTRKYLQEVPATAVIDVKDISLGRTGFTPDAQALEALGDRLAQSAKRMSLAGK